MAKEKAKAAESNGNGNSARKAAPPPGYRKQSIDVVGYWNPAESGPIHFVPRMVKLFDNVTEETKPSILIIGQLIDDMRVDAKDDATGKFEPVDAKSGDNVGVWYKPGMRAIVNLCDAKVWMNQEGERKTGKPNPMKLFSVLSPGPNKRFSMIFDEREESAGRQTDFTGPKQTSGGRRAQTRRGGGFTPNPDDYDQSADSEDIPF